MRWWKRILDNHVPKAHLVHLVCKRTADLHVEAGALVCGNVAVLGLLMAAAEVTVLAADGHPVQLEL
jgi:hypothetical protein